MSDEDTSFLKRWSLRKRSSEEQAGHKQQAEAGQAEAARPEFPETGEEEAVHPPEELPDPETLGRDADWSAYLNKSVPEDLRRRALQRLWRLDPVYSNLDGLVDYDDDYNDPVFLSRKVKTLFQVGKGMVLPESEEKKTAGGEEAVSTTAMAEQTEVSRDFDVAEPESAAAAPPAFPEKSLDEESEAPSLRNREIASQANETESHCAKPRESALKRRWGQS